MFLFFVCVVCVGLGLVVTSVPVPVQGGEGVVDVHGAMADAEVLPHGCLGNSHVEDLICEPLLVHVEDVVSEPFLAHIEDLVCEPLLVLVEELVCEPLLVHVEDLVCEPLLVHVEDLVCEPLVVHVEDPVCEPLLVHVEELDLRAYPLPCFKSSRCDSWHLCKI